MTGPGRGGLDGDVGDEFGLVDVVFSLDLQLDLEGWVGSTFGVRRRRRGRNRRCANTRAAQARMNDHGRFHVGYGSTTDAEERAETPKPSSSRMQVDSTRVEVERSGDGQPSVERECRRDSVTVPGTPSDPGRLIALRPHFPTPMSPLRCRSAAQQAGP